MLPSQSLPVVLLAFANNRVESQHYLRNLPEEHLRVREILARAQEDALCEVVDLPNATTADIVRIFQQPKYRNRIAIFHFGGHASGFSLMLEDQAGRPAAAGAVGLAQFLGVQKSLQLVFLNGCSTLGQTEGLLNAGVGAVISTASAIHDDVATNLACRFYEGLATGADLQNAFAEATSAARMEAGESTRALYAMDDLGDLVTDQLPWQLTIRPGAEAVARWNLPMEAQNPLYGLPPLPPLELEPSPFRNIRWFRREHAELFFGRGQEIRDLYQKAISPATAPIILFYGQTGTGKSSLLDAGLLPRLEQTQTVCYLRRDQEQGLLGTLQLGLLPEGHDLEPGAAWRAREAAHDRPLTIVLDQVEELYSHPCGSEAEEWKAFLQALLSVFHDSDKRPRGRLILGFRKEWLAEVKRQLTDARLPFTEVFLEDLSRRGIVEAIQGPTRVGRLQNQYHLTVEPGLAEIIADDLLEDKTGTNAPTLQVLLSRFWEIAIAQNPSAPAFTKAVYSGLKKSGILLGDFLQRQLLSIETKLRNRVGPDLLLDVLAQHTTPLGMSNQCRVDDLRMNCPIPVNDFDKLIQSCLESYLLIAPASGDGTRGEFTRLSHDTLGPLIRQRFESSDLPGQRARRILESRSVEWSSTQDGTPLDGPDLKVVESGKLGMRSWNPAEQRLVTTSQQSRAARHRGRRILQIVGAVAVALIVGAAFYANIQRNAALTEKKAAEESKRQTETTLARSFLTAFQERSVDSIEKLPLSQGELGTAWELASTDSERVREEVLREIASTPHFGERVAHRAEILTQSLVGIDLERRDRMLRFIARVFAGEQPASIPFDETSATTHPPSSQSLHWKTAIGLAAIVRELQPDDAELSRTIASELARLVEAEEDPRFKCKIAFELVAYRSYLDPLQVGQVYQRLLSIDLSRNSHAVPPHYADSLKGLAPVVAESDLVPLLKLARERWDTAGSGLTLQQTMEDVFINLGARVPEAEEVNAWKVLSQNRQIPAYMGTPPRWSDALIQLATRSSKMAALAVPDLLAEFDAQGPRQLDVLREAYATLTPEDQARFQNDFAKFSDSPAWKGLPPLPLSRDSIRQERAQYAAAQNLERGNFSFFEVSPGDSFDPSPNQIRDAQLELARQMIDRAIETPNAQTVPSTTNAIRFLQQENRLPLDRIRQLGPQLTPLFRDRTLLRDCEAELTVLIAAGQPIDDKTAATLVKLIQSETELEADVSYGFVSSFKEDDLGILISLIPKKFHARIAQMAIQAANRVTLPSMRLGWINLLHAIPVDHMSQEQQAVATDLTFSLYRTALETPQDFSTYLLMDFPSHSLLSMEHRKQLVSLIEQQWQVENNYSQLTALSRMRWNIDAPFAADSTNTPSTSGPLTFQRFFDRLCLSLFQLPPRETNSSPPMSNAHQPGDLADAIRLALPQASPENRVLAANAAFYVLHHGDFVRDSGPSLRKLLREIGASADREMIATLLQSPWCIDESRTTLLEAWATASQQSPQPGYWKQLDVAQQGGLLPSKQPAPDIPAALNQENQ